MKKFSIQIILLILLIVGLMYVATNPSIIGSILRGNWSTGGSGGAVAPNDVRKLKVGNSTITVEIADTQAKRTKGLSGRDMLPENYGVLFVFDATKRYQFWMKGMKFSIDMLFINNGKIVDILEDVPNPDPSTPDSDLPVYQSTEDINMVLEVPSGFTKQNGIKLGDSIMLIQN